MNANLAIAIVALLSELTPLLASIWKDLSPADQQKIRESYRNTLDTFARTIADSDAEIDAGIIVK